MSSLKLKYKSNKKQANYYLEGQVKSITVRLAVNQQIRYFVGLLAITIIFTKTHLYLADEAFTFEGVTLLEIFEAQYSEDRKVYPISVDGYYMMMEKSKSLGWIKKGMVFSFPHKLIEYIIGLLEGYELRGRFD